MLVLTRKVREKIMDFYPGSPKDTVMQSKKDMIEFLQHLEELAKMDEQKFNEKYPNPPVSRNAMRLYQSKALLSLHLQ